ncbi:Zn(2)-C6 fungal-type DNA-binding domain protein [Metarhizium album ARSEF 1941]|uniref:Zn(2)-C6 fungal-type DNA-binding domain protein n=1 Tax=Metarhizium album (strain ARSEF 1941) TaxID=1081103 RepID=A0A0B2WW81_METAS|nr:Zn(2)-C6 fungal-type DNA-binding domain protein [Metarhizium album ARSEF 1941]KHO00452.1 Zn(2)-C6 fungal-type DNA-binding domain protein [Metarhizium album ARSEF 1941]
MPQAALYHGILQLPENQPPPRFIRTSPSMWKKNAIAGKVSRACDACRVRKVKCNGNQPCAPCAHLSLACVFAPPPPKRKPGIRGRLVAQLRNKTSTDGPTGSPAASPPSNAQAGGYTGNDSDRSSTGPSPGAGAVPVTSIAGIVDNPTSSPRPEPPCTIGGCGFSADFFLGLLPEFEQLVYPVNPVLTPAEMRTAIHNMHSNFEDAALVHAYASVTINLTKTSWTMNGVGIASQMATLMQYCFWAHRKAEMAMESDGYTGGLQSEMPITVKRIMTCVWLEISLMAFKRFDRSYTILREAISMVQMLNVHQYGEGGHRLSRAETARRQRMYWEVYIHERFLFIMSGYPCTMAPLRTGLPLHDDTLPAHVAVGWNRLILLFQIMDDAFLSYWAAQQVPNPHLPEPTSEWIEGKQARLDQDEADALGAEEEMVAAGYGTLIELQHVDLFVTRLWLRTLVWQLALSRGLLRSAPTQNTHEGLSLRFPAQRLSAQLGSLVSRLKSVSSVVFHGSGILQKLFEITSTVADVLALPHRGGHAEAESRARLKDFFYLVQFLFGFEKTQQHQRDYLREKLEVLEKMYTVVDFRELAGASPLSASSTGHVYESMPKAS